MDCAASNSLSYKGQVTIKIKNRKGSKSEIKLHNSGTFNLGLFIAKALAGYFNNSDCPSFLDMEYQNAAGNWNSLLNNKVPLTGITYANIDEKSSPIIGSVKMLATIQSDNVRRVVVSNSNLRYSLWDGNPSKKLLAYIDNSKLQEILHNTYNAMQGQTTIVEWNLQIENKIEVSE